MEKSTLVAKLPVPILPLIAALWITETVDELLFATAKSGLPSPSKSPIDIDLGPIPVAKSTLGAKLSVLILPLIEVFRNIETVAELELVTAKSSLPSPSKSLMDNEVGPKPVVKSTLMVKLPKLMLPLVDVLRNTETVFELKFINCLSDSY